MGVGMQPEFRITGIPIGFRHSGKFRNPESGKKVNPEHRQLLKMTEAKLIRTNYKSHIHVQRIDILTNWRILNIQPKLANKLILCITCVNEINELTIYMNY